MDSNSHCLLYNYSNTLIINATETTNDTGFYVAFKVELTSKTCPSSFEAIKLCGSIGSETYCWNRTTYGWVLTNLCPEPWKMFKRVDSVTVCMQAYYRPEGIFKKDAMKACEKQGFKLTGVASDKESIWMREVMSDLDNKTDGFYLDGTRSLACQPKLCNTFDWTDGYTVGNAALDSPYAFITYEYAGATEHCLTVYLLDNYTLPRYFGKNFFPKI